MMKIIISYYCIQKIKNFNIFMPYSIINLSSVVSSKNSFYLNLLFS